MSPIEVFAIIKDQKVKRIRHQDEIIEIEFYNGAIFSAFLGCGYDNHQLEINAENSEVTSDWIE